MLRRSAVATFRRLEQQLQPKLNVPRISGRRDPSERPRAQEVIGQVEVWMIEEVEDLSTELQVQALGQRCVPQQRRIHVLKTWSIQNISSRIAKRSRWWKRKRRGVKPPIGCWI